MDIFSIHISQIKTVGLLSGHRSSFARARGGVEPGGPGAGHGYGFDPVAEALGMELYEEKVTAQFSSAGFTGEELSRQVSFKIDVMKKVRHEQDMRSYGAEVDRVEDMTVEWHVRDDGELYNAEYDTTLRELFDNTEKYYKKVGREFNRQEANAVLDIAQALVTGEGKAGTYLTFDHRGTVRYATELSIENGVIKSTYIDVGTASGRDLTWNEATRMLRDIETRHLEKVVKNDQKENEKSYPYIITNDAIHSREIKVTALSTVRQTTQERYTSRWTESESRKESVNSNQWIDRAIGDVRDISSKVLIDTRDSVMAIGLALLYEKKRRDQIEGEKKKGSSELDKGSIHKTQKEIESEKQVAKKTTLSTKRNPIGIVFDRIRSQKMNIEKKIGKGLKVTRKRSESNSPQIIIFREFLRIGKYFQKKVETHKKITVLGIPKHERKRDSQYHSKKNKKSRKQLADRTPEMHLISQQKDSLKPKHELRQSSEKTIHKKIGQIRKLWRMSNLLTKYFMSEQRREVRKSILKNESFLNIKNIRSKERMRRNRKEKRRLQSVETMRMRRYNFGHMMLLIIWHQIISESSKMVAVSGKSEKTNPFELDTPQKKYQITGQDNILPTPWIMAAIIWYLAMIREQGASVGAPKKVKQKKSSVKKIQKNPILPIRGIIFAFGSC